MWNVQPSKVRSSRVLESQLLNQLTALNLNTNNRILNIQVVNTGGAELSYVIFYYAI